jgi:hypothetical protein
MYTTPCDVPCDAFLDVEIEILGEFDKSVKLVQDRFFC